MKKNKVTKTPKTTSVKKSSPVNLDGIGATDGVGAIQIISLKDNPDGSATLDFEVDDIFINYVKKETGKKRVTKKALGDFVLRLLEKSINKIDGFDIKATKPPAK